MYKVGDKVAFIWDNKFYSGKVQSIDKNLNVFNIPYYRIKECPDPIREDMIIPSPIAKIKARITEKRTMLLGANNWCDNGEAYSEKEIYNTAIEELEMVLKWLEGSDE